MPRLSSSCPPHPHRNRLRRAIHSLPPLSIPSRLTCKRRAQELATGLRRTSGADPTADPTPDPAARPDAPAGASKRGERKGLKVSVSFRDKQLNTAATPGGGGGANRSPRKDRCSARQGPRMDAMVENDDAENATTPLIGRHAGGKRHPLAQIVCHRDEDSGSDALPAETSHAGAGSGNDGSGNADCSHSDGGSSSSGGGNSSGSDGGSPQHDSQDRGHDVASAHRNRQNRPSQPEACAQTVGLVEANRRKLEQAEQARPLSGGPGFPRPASTPKPSDNVKMPRPFSGILAPPAL